MVKLTCSDICISTALLFNFTFFGFSELKKIFKFSHDQKFFLSWAIYVTGRSGVKFQESSSQKHVIAAKLIRNAAVFDNFKKFEKKTCDNNKLNFYQKHHDEKLRITG